VHGGTGLAHDVDRGVQWHDVGAVAVERRTCGMRLNGTTDPVREISTDLNGCKDCRRRLAAAYLGMCAASLVHLHGGTRMRQNSSSRT